jgi:hypothetical protein
MESTTTRKPVVGIEVAAEVEPTLKYLTEGGPDAAGFSDYLSRFAGDLVEDLRLPAEVSLTVRTFERVDPLGRPYRIWIGGREVRVRLLSVPPGATATMVARLIAQEIFRNRELFLSEQLIQAVAERRQWENTGNVPAAGATDKLGLLLLDLVRRCLRVDRAESTTRPLVGTGEAGQDPAPAKESAEAWDSLGLKIWFGRDQYNTVLTQGSADPSEAGRSTALQNLSHEAQTLAYGELGIFLPKLELGTCDKVAAGEFRIQINDLRLPSCRGLAANQLAVWSSVAALAPSTISSDSTLNPWGGECAIIENKNEAAQKCRDLGLAPVAPLEFVTVYLGAEIKNNAAAFLNGDVVKYALNLARPTASAVVTAALSRFDLPTIGRVLRNLLEEDISIKDVRGILEALLSTAGTIGIDTQRFVLLSPIAGRVFPGQQSRRAEELDSESYADCARMSLRRHITRKYSAPSNELNAYVMDPDVDHAIREIGAESFCGVEHIDLLRAMLAAGVAKTSGMSGMPVILAQPATRRKLRRLIQRELPHLAVLNYYELLPGIKIQEVGRISRHALGGAPPVAASAT